MEWNSQTRIVAEEGVVACKILEGSALLNLSTSRYFKLNETAALLWHELEKRPEQGCTLDELCDIVASHYDIDKSECLVDICTLFDGLHKANLVKIENG